MVPIMGRKKLSTEEKSRALTMIQCGFSITRVTADLHVSRQALHDLKRQQRGFHPAELHLEKWALAARRRPQQGRMHSCGEM